MDAEILLCDAGNSALKLAFADKEGIGAAYCLPLGQAMGADSLGLALFQLLLASGRAPWELKACVACSVLPGFSAMLKGACRRFLACEALLASEDLPIPLNNRYHNPAEAGVDRLVAAFAARRAFPEAMGIVLADFGSVATFDCIENDDWLGGLLFPGLAAALEAISHAAPALPKIGMTVIGEALAANDCVPCRDTRSAMRAGVLHGYAALAQGLCGRLAKTLPEPVKLVATGGASRAFANLGLFDAIMPDLVLEGLAALYYESLSG